MRRRDEQFRELFEQYYLPVVRFFVRRGYSAEDADDLAQDTFTRAYEKFDTLSAPEKARQWLFAVASNVRRNKLRSRGTVMRTGVEVPFDEALETVGARPGRAANPGREEEKETALDELLTRERRELLLEALGKLPPRMRQAVLLRVDRDLSYREIAILQRVSVDTVKAQMLQARKKLRALLDEHFSDIDF